MEDRKEMKATSKQVEQANITVAPIIQGLASADAQHRLSEGQVEEIVGTFSQSLAAREELAAADLHIILQDCVVEVTQGGEPASPPWEAVAYHGMDDDVKPDTVSVQNFPGVAIYAEDEKDVWGALDEGCNSTAHSSYWADEMEKRLRRQGMSMPWINRETERFTGLASNAVTLGMRRMPFAMCLTNDEVISGTLESHELNSGKTPLLISLYAQATLGLVKDMGAGTVSIKGHGELRTHRCSRTGLMMINLSEFQRYQQVRKLPKSVRALRAEVIFPPAAWTVRSSCSYTYSVGLRWDFANHEIMKMERDHNVVMEILPESRRSLPTVMLDCRGIHDPDCGRYRGHVGRQLRIIKGVYTLETRVLLRRALAVYQEHGGACDVVFVCKSGRHRSVSGATLFGAMLCRMAEDNWHIVHYHSDSWRRMDCGGHCEMCNMTEEIANSLIETVESSFPKEQRSVPKPAASRAASTPKPVLVKIQSKAKWGRRTRRRCQLVREEPGDGAVEGRGVSACWHGERNHGGARQGQELEGQVKDTSQACDEPIHMVEDVGVGQCAMEGVRQP